MISASPEFHSVANGSVRPIANRLNISWTKQRADDVNWFTLGTSTLNGQDILATNEQEPVQIWDAYEWDDETDRLTSIGWSRSIEFPYNIQSATADFSLQNNDGRYTIDGKKESFTLGEIYGGARQGKALTPSANTRAVHTITGTAVVNAHFDGDSIPIGTIELGDIKLCALDDGETKDKIYKSGNDWYIQKQINYRTYTMSEIGVNTSQANIDYATLPKSNDAQEYGNTNGQFVWCTKADYNEPDNLNDTANAFYINTKGANNLYFIGIPKGTAQTVAQMAYTGATIYYRYKTPFTAKITDHTLIHELNEIERKLGQMRKTSQTNFTINAGQTAGHVSVGIQEHITELADFILPKRPVRIYTGFKKRNTAIELLPAFVGLTKRIPEYEALDQSTAKFTATDFLSEVAETRLSNTVALRNVRTDEAIAQILLQYGMDPTMFNLAPGVNTIPFAVFEKGDSTADILRKLVQAENGRMWLDELGIIRFEPRTGDIGKTPAMTFDETSISEFKPSQIDGIVNRVTIESEVRAVQQNQVIWSMENENGYEQASEDDGYRIKKDGSLDVWLNLEDPAWTASLPTLNGEQGASNFTAVKLDGTKVQSGITATGQLFTDSYKLTIHNANNFDISIDFLQLWGEPAKVIDTISYDAFDRESIEKFGEQQLEIKDNNYFGNLANADSYATAILSQRATYSPNIEMTVKGNPALQLGDIIEVDYKEAGTFKVTAITTQITPTGTSTHLKGERFTPVEAFILDHSRLDGGDVLN